MLFSGTAELPDATLVSTAEEALSSEESSGAPDLSSEPLRSTPSVNVSFSGRFKTSSLFFRDLSISQYRDFPESSEVVNTALPSVPQAAGDENVSGASASKATFSQVLPLSEESKIPSELVRRSLSPV